MGRGRVTPQSLTVLLLIVAIALRWVQLDADPRYYEWVGYLTDEGRWVENARNLYLFDSFLLEGGNLHLLFAPVFQLASYLVFEAVGMSRLTARLLPALSGTLLLLVFWAALRRRVTPEALLLGVAMLGFQVDILALSRMAVPEITALCLALTSFFTIATTPPTGRRLWLGGALLLLAVGAKITIAPLLLVYPVIALALTLRSRRRIPRRRPHLALPVAFFAAVLLLLAAAWAVTWPPLGIAPHIATIREMSGLSGFYGVVSAPFDEPLAATFNVWMIGIWVGTLATRARPRGSPADPASSLMFGGAIWFAASYALILGLRYFPARYQVHALPPLALLVTIAASRFQQTGLSGIEGWLAAGRERWRWPRCAYLSAPTAVLLAPGILWLGSALGSVPQRLTTKLAAIVVSWVAVSCVVRAFEHKPGVVRFLLLFPLVVGPCWWLWSVVGPGVEFWAGGVGPPPAAWLTSVALGASVGVALGTRFVALPLSARPALVALALACAVAAIVHVAPGYIDPRHTLRDVSRDLGHRLSGEDSIVTVSGEGLFIDNALRYRSLYQVDWRAAPPRVVVGVLESTWGPRYGRFAETVRRDYDSVATYELFVSPRFLARYEADPARTDGVTRVTVYRHRSGTRLPGS